MVCDAVVVETWVYLSTGLKNKIDNDDVLVVVLVVAWWMMGWIAIDRRR